MLLHALTISRYVKPKLKEAHDPRRTANCDDLRVLRADTFLPFSRAETGVVDSTYAPNPYMKLPEVLADWLTGNHCGVSSPG